MIPVTYTEAINGKPTGLSYKLANYVSKKLNETHTINSLKKKYNTEYDSTLLNDLLNDNVIDYEIYNNEMKNLKPEGPGIITTAGNKNIRKMKHSEEWLSDRNIVYTLDNYNREFNKNLKVGGCHNMTFFECTCGRHELETEQRIFKSYGYEMRDFQETNSNFSNFDILKELENKNYNCFGCVFNTDVSSGRGIHWVAVFINLIKEPYTFEYFDSAGQPIMDELIEFFKKQEKKLKQQNIKSLIIHVSNRIQQKDYHSCGPYSLYYIRARLEGVPWMYFRDFEIGDTKMHDFRKNLFRISS